MTLLEMIEKYERVKTELEQVYRKDAITQVETVEAILDDLKSIRDQQPSWVTVRDKIMKNIDEEIERENYDDVRTLAQALQMLPD